MMDRQARDDMSRALRAFMAEELTAFEFDETLDRIADETEDETIHAIGQALWFHYDDCTDHKIVATKSEWDYFNRLLLILESGAEIETVSTSWRWHVGQGVAAASLAAFGCVALWAGFGEHLLVYAMPFGLVSMLLARFNGRKRRKRVTAAHVALMPFSSVGSLLSVRRNLAGFVRRKYPAAIGTRRIRGAVENAVIRVPSLLAWLMFSPVVLFFQMLPERETETTIHVPRGDSESQVM